MSLKDDGLHQPKAADENFAKLEWSANPHKSKSANASNGQYFLSLHPHFANYSYPSSLMLKNNKINFNCNSLEQYPNPKFEKLPLLWTYLSSPMPINLYNFWPPWNSLASTSHRSTQCHVLHANCLPQPFMINHPPSICPSRRNYLQHLQHKIRFQCMVRAVVFFFENCW